MLRGLPDLAQPGGDDLDRAGFRVALLEFRHPRLDHVAGDAAGHEDNELVDLGDAGSAERQVSDARLDDLTFMLSEGVIGPRIMASRRAKRSGRAWPGRCRPRGGASGLRKPMLSCTPCGWVPPPSSMCPWPGSGPRSRRPLFCCGSRQTVDILCCERLTQRSVFGAALLASSGAPPPLAATKLCRPDPTLIGSSPLAWAAW